ncbi:MAG: hypothetical protein U9R42_05775 [Bacteroidota bacterium]|nr:hypothetical protein [Bacteroidota bacterium]
MKSLFEKEEKETELNQLKVDLLSRFFPFSKEEVLLYKPVLNFGRYQLMNNELIEWDIEMLDELGDKIDWTAIWKIKNIKLDFDFFKKYESKIDFTSIHLSENINWSNDLLSTFGEKFDWKWLITREPLSTIENLRRFKDKLDWANVSQRLNIDFNEAVLEEFADKWDWKKLSSNPNLPLSIEFIKKHINKLDFDNLSQNPKCINFIYKYPTSKRWNWEKVLWNPAITYNKKSFDFIFYYYKKYYASITPYYYKIVQPLPSFFFKVFKKPFNDKSFFLNEEFIKYLPWDNLCKFSYIKLSLDFIEKYKDKLNFKETEFLRIHRDILTTNFIEENLELFDSEHSAFYYLPITIALLRKYDDKINWNNLSNCEKLDWTWEYIYLHFEKFNLFWLRQNKGIYEKLIRDKLTKPEILEFLDNELIKRRK